MSDNVIGIPESFTFENAKTIFESAYKIIKQKNGPKELIFDFQLTSEIDSGAVAAISKIRSLGSEYNCRVLISNCLPEIQNTIDLFILPKLSEEKPREKAGLFEKLGAFVYEGTQIFKESIILFSNVFYWAVAAFFKKKLRRKGEVVNQSILIGVNALPIIALIAFLIGLILALQSAAQLRQFGANIYVADLVAIAMISEMGPLITAIMVAGRSGSAIAAEIATMQVSEEIDALKVMGIDPVPYLVIPKLYSSIITLPLLTIFANLIGILGGLLIGITYLDLDVISFYNEVISVIRYKEIFTSIIKSLCFAVIIVITAAFFGFRAKGGAEDVGRATTTSVVVSIFMVIAIDSLLGMIFYFGEPAF